jgi:hypothetical protein
MGLQKGVRVGWTFAGIFMFAIGVHVHPFAKPFFKALSPVRQLLCRVVFPLLT